MKKRSFFVLLVFVTVFLFFLTSIPAQAQEKAMKLRLSTMWPTQHPLTRLFADWGKDVEKATKDRKSVV
jgi:TRAP-type C4-dicarboxylate transport system substrate-binding protein